MRRWSPAMLWRTGPYFGCPGSAGATAASVLAALAHLAFLGVLVLPPGGEVDSGFRFAAVALTAVTSLGAFSAAWQYARGQRSASQYGHIVPLGHFVGGIWFVFQFQGSQAAVILLAAILGLDLLLAVSVNRSRQLRKSHKPPSEEAGMRTERAQAAEGGDEKPTWPLWAKLFAIVAAAFTLAKVIRYVISYELPGS